MGTSDRHLVNNGQREPLTKPAPLLAFFLLLWGSAPFNLSNLPLNWCTSIAVITLAILLWLGPPITRGRSSRTALWLSLAIFCSSLFSQIGLPLNWPKEWIVLVLVFALWLGVARSRPTSHREAQARKNALRGVYSFIIASDWLCHTRFTLRAGGERWAVDLPLVEFFVDPTPPYDRYLVFLLETISVASLAAIIGFTVLYTVYRRQSENLALPTQARESR